MPSRIGGTATDTDAAWMRAIAEALDDELNPGRPKTVGFVVLTFPFAVPGSFEGQCNYISNGADRRDMIAMLKELVARFEGQARQQGHG
jgi:hypothetical protein